MAYPPTAIYAWLAQHHDENALAGGAFLLAPDIAVTCAHVVCDHLGLGVSKPPMGLVSLNFPALNIKRQAHVVPNGWIQVEVEGGADVLRDVALLRLTEPVEMKGFGCIPLATSAPPGGGLARIWGAGPGWQATGQEVEVKLGQGLNHTGRRQLTNRDGHGFTTKQGFSGSPLFDDHMTVIWGMVQQVAPEGERVTLALGADRLQEALRRAGLSLASTAGGAERERPRKSRGQLDYIHGAADLKVGVLEKHACTLEHTSQQFLDGLRDNHAEASSAQKEQTQGDSTLGENTDGYKNVKNTILPTDITEKLEEIDGYKKIKRQDSCDVRFDKLKNLIIECLIKSSKSMTAIAEQLNIHQATSSEKLEERANLLCQSLLSTHFDDALKALNNARKKISAASNDDHQVIADVTAWLLPWLHTEALDIDRTTWEYKNIGEILSFPAEIPSFADIVMAGLDIRPIKFDMSTPNARWVRSPLSLNLDVPEIGIDAGNHVSVKAEDAIRTALAKAVGVPEIKLGQGPEIIDQSIDECLDYFLDEEWKRHYFICRKFDNKEDQEKYRSIISKIAERYKKLAVIDIEIINCGHQRIFETIRNLIHGKGDQK